MPKRRATRRDVHHDPRPSETEARSKRYQSPYGTPKAKAAASGETAKMADRLFKPAKFHPKGPGQVAFLDAIDRNDICFGIGPAGSGKSYLAVAKACEALKAGDVKSIALYRPYVPTGRTMGYLPGDVEQKMEPYFRQLLKYFAKFLSPEEVASAIKDGTLELGAMEHVRSSSFEEMFIILDEGQNAVRDELRVFLTRIGEGSKMLILGDPCQSDLPPHERGALDYYSTAYLPDRPDGTYDEELEGFARVEMTEVDVVRHRLVKAMIRRGH